MSGLRDSLGELSRAQLELLAVKLDEALEEMSTEVERWREPIAVVGAACRMPASPSLGELWRLLDNARSGVREIPGDRWDYAEHYDPDPEAPRKMYTRWGGFVESAERFDAEAFGISGREAMSLDPQQRMLLEVTWEALDEAGLPRSVLGGSRTGVYVGIATTDYAQLRAQSGGSLADDRYSGTGTSFAFAAGRISYVFGLNGPNLSIDTMCSSSLVAACLAVESLRSGESDVGIVGGVNSIITPESTAYMSKLGAMAFDGRCKTFDVLADGYVRGEGCGIVVLKRLSDAIADGDRVLAVLRGGAFNHGGASAGLTVPNGAAQTQVIEAALRNAGVDPEEVDYVEAHGTGTALGDPIELRALAQAYGAGGNRGAHLSIGSLKTNIGHLEAAAGVAGLLKVVLAFQHQVIPAHLELKHLTPRVDWEQLPLVVPTASVTWPRGPRARLAGVSSFGMSGTNAHVIVEEAPAEAVESLGEGEGPYLLPLSGRSEGAAKGMVERWSKHLSSSKDGLLDQLYTASARRSHYESRVAVVAKSRQELSEKLASYAATGSAARVMSGERKGEVTGVTFVYSGQGSQWARMGIELMSQEPEFAQALKAFDDAWQKLAAFSIISELSKPKEATRLSDTEIAQPCIVAIQVALTALWKSWGIAPENVIGHSIGEVTAGYVAGVYSLEDTVKVLFHRSRLMQKATGQGKMTSIEAPRGTVEAELSQLAPEQASKVSIGADNSPQSTVISGEASAVDALSKRLQEKGVTTRELGVNYAFHSAQMADIAKELEAALSGLAPKPAQLGLYSTVTGAASTGSDWTAGYWRKNVGQAVEFRKATGTAIQEGAGAFIEVGPHPVLSVPLRQTVEASGKSASVTHSLRRDKEEKLELLTQLGALYTSGYDVDWKKLYPKRGRVVSLPSYAWQKKRYWIDAGKKKKSTAGAGHEVHPLLGQRLQLSTCQDEVFEAQWSLEALPYLEGHKVFGTVVCPGAAYAEMGLSAGRQALGLGVELQLEGLEIQQPLTLDSKAAREVQLVVAPNEDGASGKFQIASRPALEGKVSKGKAAWTIHASGRLGKRSDAGVAPLLLASAKEQHKASEDVSDFYEKFLGLGLGYTGSFAGVRELYRGTAGSKSALGRVELAGSSVGDAAESGRDYGLHPALMDGCFQVMAAAVGEGSGGETPIYLPVGIEALSLEMLGAEAVWCHARVEGEVGGEMLKAHLTLWDEGEQFLGEVKGLTVRKTSRAALEKMFRKGLDDWFYEVGWQEAEKEETALAESASRWVIFADKSGVGRELGKKFAGSVIVHQGEVGSALLQETESSWRVDGESKAQVEELFVKLGAAGGKTEVVYLWGLDAPSNGELTAERLAQWQHQGGASALCVTQALAAKAAQASAGASWRLSLVTSGAQAAQAGESAAVAQAPLWGFGRVVSQEHPELGCVKLDLEAGVDAAQQAESLVAELKLQSKEDQVALRGGKRLVARLIRSKREASVGEQIRALAAGESFEICASQSGVVEQMELRRQERKAPGAGEVEVEVKAAALNFRDVLNAMNMIPGDIGKPLGKEFAGVVTRVGLGVSRFAPGDEVMGLAIGSFASHARVAAEAVMPKPRGLNFEEAAAIPLVMLTAEYGLTHLAKLKAGERVLVHAAAGGVGLAAIQIAQRAGAEVWGTAGSDEKRELLKGLGVARVFDSRSLGFAEEILRLTEGRGVDVVLNSLNKEFIPKSLSVLAKGGRFVEIGKIGVWSVEQVRELRPDAGYYPFDLGEVMVSAPETWERLRKDVVEAFEAGELKPLRHQVWPMSSVVPAMEYMKAARHIGKIVLKGGGGADAHGVRADASYLITGGLGGLGLQVAEWMVKQGAKHLVLAGRSAPSDIAKAAIARMTEAGAQVTALRADVSKAEDVQRLVDVCQGKAPLKGVIHAAGVLDDGMLGQQAAARFDKVMGPKALGAWNLHEATKHLELDQFVMFSSMASVFGNAGQSNYAAANAFLDALAWARAAQGLPAQSQNWGAWAEAGMAAAQSQAQAERWKAMGMDLIGLEQGIEAYGQLLQRSAAQLTIAPVDWAKMGKALREAPPLLGGLLALCAGAKQENEFVAKLTAAPENKRRGMVLQHVREQVRAVLGLSPSAQLDDDKGLFDVGMDSLTAVELRNRLQASLGVQLSATLILEKPAVATLSADLLEMISPRSMVKGMPEEIASPEVCADGELGDMDQDELMRVLDQQLALIEGKE